jgi:ATP-binding cassette subfamily B protein
MAENPEPRIPVRRLLRMLADTTRGSWRQYGLAAAGVLCATAFSYVTPLVLRFAIDTVIDGRDFSLPLDLLSVGGNAPPIEWFRANLWACALAMLVCAAAQGVADYGRALFASKASEGFARRLRNRLFDHLNHQPFAAMSGVNTGDLVQRCTSDIETVRQFLETQLVEVTRILMMVLLAVPVMLLLNPTMTLTATILLPAVILGSVYYFGQVRRVYGTVTRSEARMSTVMQENLTGMRLVKSFAREPFEQDRFEEANSRYRDDMKHLMRTVSFYWGLSAFLCMGQICLVLAVGAWRASNGLLTVGTFAVFFTYVVMLVWPIRMLGHVLSDAGRAHVSLSRIASILSRPREEPEPGALRPPIRGAVEFRNVSFAYSKGHPALKDITFSVRPGTTVAILGRTGSGKSTLVHLIPRLLEYTAGSIRLDGCELRQIDREWVRGNVGIVLQEPFLFSRSIRENILLGETREADSEKAEHRMLEVARVADIHRTVRDKFRQGYETVIGERGVTLSGGQRQRLAIARALMGSPPILILDDSLSAVDAETDRKIQVALRERHGTATTFIISHRISTLSQADVVLVLEDGRLSQVDTPRNLARGEGLYRRIHDIQNELEADLRNVREGAA